MYTYEKTKKQLNDIFCDVFDDEGLEIFDTMTADDIDEWDSLSHITLVLTIEKAFNIKLKAAEVGELSNVGEMIKLLMSRTA